LEVTTDKNGLLHILPELPAITFKGLSCFINNCYQGEMYVSEYAGEKNDNEIYRITSGAPAPHNHPTTHSKTLWTVNNETGATCLNKIIQHSSPITSSALSRDDRYFASNSNKGQLIITHLTESDENPLFSDTILIPDHNTERQICFNNASTILATSGGAIFNETICGEIKLWSMKTKKLLSSFYTDPHTIPLKLIFSDDDSALISVSTHLTNNKVHIITLWDMNNQEKPSQLSTVFIDKGDRFFCPMISFINETIIIPAQNKLIILDKKTGAILKTITHTHREIENHTYQVIIPLWFGYDTDFLFLGMRRSDTSNCIKIIDYCNDQCIATLELQGKGLTHIGLSPAIEKIISTFGDHSMVTTELYNSKDLVSLAQTIRSSNLLHQYLLWRIAKAKQKKQSPSIHQSLQDYVEQTIPTDENGKEMIKKYLLS